MHLTTATPSEIDTAYLPHAEALSVAEHRLTTAERSHHTSDTTREHLIAARDAAAANTAPFLAEWDRRGGWTRAYLALSTDGHVHSSTSCSTLHHGRTLTPLTILPEFSGHDEAEIIAAAGWRACTVCYPGAPVGDPRSLPSSLRVDRDAVAEREARAEAKAEREAKRLANAPTASGEPLTVELGWSETFRTERAASTAYVDALLDDVRFRDAAGYQEHGLPAGGLRAIEEALAGKHGRSVSDQRALLVEKARAKAKREGLDVGSVPTDF